MEKDDQTYAESIAKRSCILLTLLCLLCFVIMNLTNPGKLAPTLFFSGALTLFPGVVLALDPPKAWTETTRHLFRKMFIRVVAPPCVILMITGVFLEGIGIYPHLFH